MGVTVTARTGLRNLVSAVYPPQCLGCNHVVAVAGALCGPCRREAFFLAGVLTCATCALPLDGPEAPGETVFCNACAAHPRPWRSARAAFHYEGTGRRLVLALKHGDRTDLARPLGRWMAEAGAGVLDARSLLVPIPLHWTRLLARRYNQAALLAREAARAAGCDWAPEALRRSRRTPTLKGLRRAERATTLAGAITPHPREGARMAGRAVVLVDDVMTSGATLAEAAFAARAAGAAEIAVLMLARAPGAP